MGVRFNKRITILPWLKANVGKSGISLTLGPKGKTLNIGSTGVSVNVSLGKGMGYSKRLITWKKLAAPKKKGKQGTTAATDITLDEAIAEAEKTRQGGGGTPAAMPVPEQGGCSWGFAVLGCLGLLILLALLAVVLLLLLRSGELHP